MVKLTVNETIYNLEVDPEMPLLWVLRDHLDLKGCKFGCGKGLCGACTVHIDGQPVRSCIMPVAAAKNTQITTIEGLSKDDCHPVQLAWRKLSVPQCGYCQSGQIMQAAASIEKMTSPDDKQIAQYMSGNICRCGTYTRIREGIKLAYELNTSKSEA